MKTAQELYQISKESNLKIIANIIEETKEDIVRTSEADASYGFTYSKIYLIKKPIHLKYFLINECIKLAKEFEEKGYKLSINTFEDEFEIGFIITLSWTDEEIKLYDNGLVYVTGKEINNKKRKVEEKNNKWRKMIFLKE